MEIKKSEKKKKFFLKRLLTNLLVLIAAIIVLFEDWVWSHISTIMAQISKLKLIYRFENWLKSLNPYLILLFFAVPIIALLPIKILALYFFASGMIVRGTMVFIAGKIIGTAIAAKLFLISKEKLLTIALFGKIYYWIIGFKKTILDRLHETSFYQKIHSIKQYLGDVLRKWREKQKSKPGIWSLILRIKNKIRKNKSI